MRVLHVIPGLTRERGGPTVVLQALTRHQAGAGHAVTVLTTDQGARTGETPVELDGAVEVERLAVVGPNRLAYAPGFAAAMRRRLRETDVVHVHSIFTQPVHAALTEAAAVGVPVILRPCGLLHPYSLRRSRWLKRTYLTVWGNRVRRACTAWHYTSENEARASWPQDASTHFVIPNGIEPAEFALDRREARAVVARTWPQVGDAPYVLFLGRLHPKKRLDLLVEAFVAGAPASFKLVVAGPDEEVLWPGIAARVPAGAEPRVVRLSTVGGREKAALLAGARLFALPSEHENFGVAALEALAAGTPVLLSPHVDLADAAVAADVGTIAPLHVVDWAERLSVLTGIEPTPELVARARQWVAANYAWDRIVAAMTERYEWILGSRPAAPAREVARA
jgi:glycosyltransferase involved in cell wall biosynthesis